MGKESLPPLRRLPAGPKLLASVALSAGVAMAERPTALLGLGAAVVVLYGLSKPERLQLLADLRWLIVQSALVLAIHCARFGWRGGIDTGALATARIDLFFLTAAALVRSSCGSQMMRDLQRIIPYRLAFLAFCSLRFFPVFRRELTEIASTQRLRGARLAPRRLADPRCWKDLVDCLLFPVVVRSLKASQDAALSAEAREFGVRPTRSHWDAHDPRTGLVSIAHAGSGACAPPDPTQEPRP